MLFPTATFTIFFLVVLPLSWLAMADMRRWRVVHHRAPATSSTAGGTGTSSSCSPAARSGTTLLAVQIYRAGRAVARARRCSCARASPATSACSATSSTTTSSSARRTTWLRHGRARACRSATRSIVLPVGISFFTFMAISYVVDIYRGDFEPVTLGEVRAPTSRSSRTSSPGRSCAPGELLPQLETPRDPRRVDTSRAFYLIATGPLQEGRDRELPGDAHRRPGVRACRAATRRSRSCVAIYAYAVQIYADFSGYTDMAIGLALLLGFRFPQNFDSPVRRGLAAGLLAPLAHDAVALAARLPLHPARRQPEGPSPRRTVNLMLTMLLGGLWHGAVVDVRRLGRRSTAPGSRSSTGGATGPAYVEPRRRAACGSGCGGSSPSTSSASPGSSSAPTRSTAPGR